MNTPRILAFSGSARVGSFNQRLVQIAADAARESGASVRVISLGDFPLPIFNQDLESNEGPPEHALRLKQLMIDSDGFLIACPEYNSSITPLLKNAIDWASRADKDHAGLAAFRGKVCGLLSASPGRLGGLRGLAHVRSILSNIGVIVLPDQVAVPGAHEAFADDGQRLQDDNLDQAVRRLGREVAETARLLSSRPPSTRE